MRYILFVLFTIAGSFFLSAEPKTRQEIVGELFVSIESWFGVPYILGGMDKKGVDCSGFTKDVYKKIFNYDLPRTVTLQKTQGKLVAGKLQPGDLLFFDTIGGVSHVGIYVFDNKFIHAASGGPKVGVIKSSLNEKYYKDRYLFARRIVELPPYKNDSKKQNNYITFYKFMHNGKMIDKSVLFKASEPIFFKVNNKSGEKEIKISFYDAKTKKNEIINIESPLSNEIRSVRLKSGNYIARLLKNENVLYEKEIIVNSDCSVIQK